MFSRPATYDPRLAQRAQQQYQRNNHYDDYDDYGDASARRKKQQQLKDELGLSDDDQGEQLDGEDGDFVDDEDSGARRARRRARAATNKPSAVGSLANPEMEAQCEHLRKELAVAKENEQRAQDSLSKLQLLSKSQTAILKTTMQKKLQEKGAIVEELANVIKDLERQLRDAGANVREFNVDEIVGPSCGSNANSAAGEAEAIAEISSMKSELEKLMEENKVLREKATAATSAKNASPSTDGEMVRKVELDKLQAEKQRLTQQLKEAQLQLATPVAPVAHVANENAADNSKVIEQLEADKKKLMGQMKEMQQQLQKTNAAAAEAKAAAAKAAAATSGDTPPPAPAPTAVADASVDSEELKRLQKQVCVRR